MGLIRFSKASRALPPSTRRKITFASSIGVASLIGVVFAVQELCGSWNVTNFDEIDFDEFTRQLTEANSSAATGQLYPADAIFGPLPYDDVPLGTRFACILHMIGITYMLIGLNTVCDTYFAGSIDVLVEVWQMTPDVAGATFMAAGGSMPELFTSLIGATIAMNDVGFGTIVGSAVFNVLFVIGLCGYVAKGNIDLTWWPLFRDCTYYIFALGVLAAFTFNQLIQVWEAAILFCLYLGYIVLMFFNSKLQAWAYAKAGTKKTAPEPEDSQPEAPSPSTVQPMPLGVDTKDEPTQPTIQTDNYVSDAKLKDEDAKTDATATTSPKASEGDAKATDGEGGEGEEGGDDDDDDFMVMPSDTMGKVMWALCLPVYVPIYYTLPMPSEKLYWVSFLLALIWIAGFSFLLVWWTETVGAIIGVPTILMGLTVIAAGTSIPDAVSSMAVAREGQADMAVSSSIGSNIFDILVGLPVPWMLKCLIEASSGNTSYEGVVVRSPYLVFYVVLLLGMVFAVVVCIHLSGWKLSKKLGTFMAVLYAVFLVLAIVVQATEPTWLRTN